VNNHFDRGPSIFVGWGLQRYVSLWPSSIYQKRPKLIRLSAKGLSKRIKGECFRTGALVILISRHATPHVDHVHSDVVIKYMHYAQIPLKRERGIIINRLRSTRLNYKKRFLTLLHEKVN